MISCSYCFENFLIFFQFQNRKLSIELDFGIYYYRYVEKLKIKIHFSKESFCSRNQAQFQQLFIAPSLDPLLFDRSWKEGNNKNDTGAWEKRILNWTFYIPKIRLSTFFQQNRLSLIGALNVWNARVQKASKEVMIVISEQNYGGSKRR